jgi:hypothetical protein
MLARRRLEILRDSGIWVLLAQRRPRGMTARPTGIPDSYSLIINWVCLYGQKLQHRLIPVLPGRTSAAVCATGQMLLKLGLEAYGFPDSGLR